MRPRSFIINMLNKIQEKMDTMIGKINNFIRELESIKSEESFSTEKYNI